MFKVISTRYPVLVQYLVSSLLIMVLTGICFFIPEVFSYRSVALILLLGVSLLAMVFDIFPVLLAAFLSALAWDFLFIPPRFTLTVGKSEDSLFLLMYFLVVFVQAVLTNKIRKAEKREREKEDKENAVKLYSTILNSLSHELRTPIATIIGAVDTLKENADKLSKEQQTELLHETNIAANRLNRQVENLLGMSRLEAVAIKPKKDWVDITDVVSGVINELRGSHLLGFTPDDKLPLFKLDVFLVRQVIYNLVHNAVQYTPPGTVIRVEIDFDEALLIRVSDEGPGIPENDLQTVFSKFHRGENTNTGGIGLGLSVVKGFTEAHGGTVSAENRPGGGAQFTVRIPAEVTFINKLKND